MNFYDEIKNVKRALSRLNLLTTAIESELAELEAKSLLRANARADYEETKPFSTDTAEIREASVDLTKRVMDLQRSAWLRYVEEKEVILENNSTALENNGGAGK